MARGQLIDDATEEENQEHVDEELARFGLKRVARPTKQPDEKFCLWSENVKVFNIWMAVQTQWMHAGMSGAATGLNYQGVESTLRMKRIADEEWPDIFAGLHAMERATLSVWAEQRK